MPADYPNPIGDDRPDRAGGARRRRRPVDEFWT